MWRWGDMDWNWGWDWGSGIFAAVGVIFVLAIFIVPWFLFLLNLQHLLERVSDRNRAMPAAQVWLNFIPIFSLGWFIYTVIKVRDSVRAEYETRGWMPESDLGYNVGLAAGILAAASFVLGWVPLIGWGAVIAWVVCWIIYWLKTADLKNRLGAGAAWAGSASPPPYSQYGAPAGPAAPVAPAAAAPSPTVAPSPAQAAACAGCGVAYDPGDRFCRTCGLPLP